MAVELISFGTPLKKENQELKQEVRDLKLSLQALKVDEKEVTNVDIIRRLSQLEKMVYGTRSKEEENN